MRVNPEKKEEKERVTQALLRATLQLAAAHGFTSLGLREVSRAADIAPTSFYRHFADMEALGLALVEILVRPVIHGWIERAGDDAADACVVVEALVGQALSTVDADPELMRFVIAERAGAIPSFRAAIRKELSAVSIALVHASRPRGASPVAAAPAHVGDSATALLLEGCARRLDGVTESDPSTHDELSHQMRVLLTQPRSAGRAS